MELKNSSKRLIVFNFPKLFITVETGYNQWRIVNEPQNFFRNDPQFYNEILK